MEALSAFSIVQLNLQDFYSGATFATLPETLRMRKHIASMLLLFCLFAMRPAFAQDSSRLNDLDEKVSRNEKKEMRAARKLEKQQKKLERKQEKVKRKANKLERRQNKTDRQQRKRNREERKVEDEKQTPTAWLHPAVYRNENRA